jgi:hypothetical protein
MQLIDGDAELRQDRPWKEVIELETLRGGKKLNIILTLFYYFHVIMLRS